MGVEEVGGTTQQLCCSPLASTPSSSLAVRVQLVVVLRDGDGRRWAGGQDLQHGRDDPGQEEDGLPREGPVQEQHAEVEVDAGGSPETAALKREKNIK
jgi:hypothetical protein